MRKSTALWSFTLLVSLVVWTPAAQAAAKPQHVLRGAFAYQWNAPPQAAQAKNWKSRDEYDAYTAMGNEKDPNKKISLAEAFLQKYSNSDFKSGAYLVEMQAYFQLGKSDQAIDAAKKALQGDPDNLDALGFLSYVFPFTFKVDDPNATANLSRAESDAKHGLELLQKIQKPANVSDEQFTQFVKPKRAVFNGTVGFVALQRKDYATAITSYKAASEDNPSDWYVFYRMGLAYLYSNPHDYDHGIWYIARALALAQAAKDPNAQEFDSYLKKTYIGYHGNDQGLQDIVAQAAASVNPPDGFKVAAMEAPKHTGNPLVDGFNDMTYPLKFGGDTAQKAWDSLKGQPLELGGVVDSIVKGSEAGTYLVRIAILDQSKATPGVYDIEVKDSKQPDVKNLERGDIVRFKGTADSYAATPNLVLTVAGQITDPDPLPDKPPVKEKPKPKAPVHHHTTHTTTTTQ
jgi:tetratricopeptide (TPR) repeat protein